MLVPDLTDRDTRRDLRRRLIQRHDGDLDAAAADAGMAREEFDADNARLGIGARIPIAEQRSLRKSG